MTGQDRPRTRLSHCPICNGDVEDAQITLTYPLKDSFSLCQMVTGQRCLQCKEEFFDDSILQEANNVVKHISALLNDIIDVSELAAYLRTHENTIYSMVKEGKLPGYKVGREWRFLRTAIDRLLSTFPNEEAAVAQENSPESITA